MLKYIAIRIAFALLGRLPLPLLYGIASLGGEVAYRLARSARANVHDNLRHVMPNAPDRDIARAARQVFRHVAYYYADLAQLQHMPMDTFLEKRIIYHGVEEYLRPAVHEGKGVIMLSAHVGNAEMAGQALIPLGMTAFALTEPIEPPRLARMLNRIRASKGLTFMPVSVAGVKRVMQTLRSGGIVALMGDRDIEGPKMRLPFFGVETYLPTGPIEVALRTGATVFPSFSARRRKWVIEAYLEPALEIERTGDFEADVGAAMLKFVARMEEFIAREPGQWAVLERVWDDASPAPAPAGEKSERATEQQRAGVSDG